MSSIDYFFWVLAFYCAGMFSINMLYFTAIVPLLRSRIEHLEQERNLLLDMLKRQMEI